MLFAEIRTEMLKLGGLETSDYQFVETGNTAKRVDALEAGEYRATLLVGNYINQAYEAGFKRLDDSLARLGPYQGSSFGLNRDWAEQNPETVIAFIRAYVRAMDIVYDENRRSEVIGIITGHTSMTPAIAGKTLDQMTSGTYGFTPRAALDADGVKLVLKLRNQYGSPAADLSNLEDFVDLSYYERALESVKESLNGKTQTNRSRR